MVVTGTPYQPVVGGAPVSVPVRSGRRVLSPDRIIKRPPTEAPAPAHPSSLVAPAADPMAPRPAPAVRSPSPPRRESRPVWEMALLQRSRRFAEAFRELDLDNDGLVSARYLSKVLRTSPNVAGFLGLPPHACQDGRFREAVERAARQLDTDPDRSMSWPEFQALVEGITAAMPQVTSATTVPSPPVSTARIVAVPVAATQPRPPRPVASAPPVPVPWAASAARAPRAATPTVVPAAGIITPPRSPQGARGAQGTPPRRKEPFAGDRGTLSPPTPARGVRLPPEQRPPQSDQAGSAEAREKGLSHDLAVREVELRVLRSQVDAQEREASRLRDRVADAEQRLSEASGSVELVSAQVEAATGRRQAVLGASAKHLDAHVTALRHKSARMEWELSEKDEEIERLRQATHAGQQKLETQRAEAGTLQQGRLESQQALGALDRSFGHEQRHHALGDWCERTRAQIEHDHAATSLARERRARQKDVEKLEEEISKCRLQIMRLNDQSKLSRDEMERHQRICDNLRVKEQLCDSAVRIGEESAAEQKSLQAAEKKKLEAQIQNQIAAKAAKAPGAHAYDAREAEVDQAQAELAALTACMRDIQQALGAPAPPGRGDSLDIAITKCTHEARAKGQAVPPVTRIGPGRYFVGDQAESLVLTKDGGVCVRAPEGTLTLLKDYLQSRARVGSHQHGGAGVPPGAGGGHAGQRPASAGKRPPPVGAQPPPSSSEIFRV